MTEMRKYEPRGLLALDPQAFGLEYGTPATEEPQASTTPTIAVVPIRGPLEHHRNPFFGSYDAILDQVELACSTPAKHVVLLIDSPGGSTYGLFETAQLIRACVEASGKTLHAYVDGQCSSAAYALACSADEIVIGSTSTVGSVGVIDTRVDVTQADAAMGVKFSFTTSGTTKAFGHPHVALTDEERAEKQVIVDQLAAVFFDFVRERRGLDAQPLQARIYAGQAAVQAGLADRISTYPDFIAGLGTRAAETGESMSATDEARKALQKAAESDNEEEAQKAKAALAALDAENEDEEKKDDEPAAESDEDEDKEATAALAATASVGTVSASTAGEMAGVIDSLRAEIAQVRSLQEATERKALFASRPDIPADVKKVLKNKPLAEVRALFAAMPKKGSNLAASTVGCPIPGATTGAPTPTSAELDAIDARMGVLALQSVGVEHSETHTVLGAPKAIAPKGA